MDINKAGKMLINEKSGLRKGGYTWKRNEFPFSSLTFTPIFASRPYFLAIFFVFFFFQIKVPLSSYPLPVDVSEGFSSPTFWLLTSIFIYSLNSFKALETENVFFKNPFLLKLFHSLNTLSSFHFLFSISLFLFSLSLSLFPKARRHADMSTLVSTSASMSTFRSSLFYSTYTPDMEGKVMVVRG